MVDLVQRRAGVHGTVWRSLLTTAASPLLHKGPEKRRKEPGARFQGAREEVHGNLGVRGLIGDKMPMWREPRP